MYWFSLSLGASSGYSGVVIPQLESDDSEIKLTGSLDKTIYFRARPLAQDEVEKISTSISEVVNSRLERFDEFLALVESEADPTAALTAKFG